MSADPNVFTSTFERELGAARGTSLGGDAGARDLGIAAYELDPGGQAAPYHQHEGQEELLIVLAGTPELRTPAGRRTLQPGAVVAFPAGDEGAHRLRNASEQPCRYVVVGVARQPEVVRYPDTGAILAMTAAGAGWAWPAGADSAYMDVLGAALRAEPEA